MLLSIMLRCLIIVAGTLSLAILATKEAALAHWRHLPPESVPHVWSRDPVIRLRAAETSFIQPERTAGGSSGVSIDAMRVLRASPLNGMALAQIGFVAETDQSGAGAKLLRLAERVSRRDSLTQLLLIDQASRAGDIQATLAHYDRAISVHPATSAQLFPILARAIDDPGIRAGLARLTPRPWFSAFILSAAGHDADATQVVVLLDELQGRLAPNKVQEISTHLLPRLVAGAKYDTARALARQMPGIDPDVIDQIGFATATLDPRIVPLGWRLGSDDAIEAEVEGDALVVGVEPERTALAAERVTLLAAGDYVLTERVAYDAAAPRAGLEWQISCLPEQRILMQTALPASQALAVYSNRLSIPANCPAQSWKLRVYGEVSQLAAKASLTILSLARP